MKPTVLILVALGLAACEQPAPEPAASVDLPTVPASRPTAASAQPSVPAQAQTAPLIAAGSSAMIDLLQEDGVQTAAAVVRVDPLARQGDHTVKLFGTAGGDPAMNGLYTQIAFFEGADTGWAVFRIGDFLDYRVLSESPGRVDLEVTESVQHGEAGDIGSRTRRLIVGWTPPEYEGAPESITVTPAR
jgi:hypothetical protein